MNHSITIRPASPTDFNAILEISQKVIEPGDTYPLYPTSSEEPLLNYWFKEAKQTFVAESENQIVGVYRLKPNQIGLGDHVANGSYMVHPDHQRKGIGRQMGEHSLLTAKALGFQAMQFNHVIKSNTSAVELWKKLGFQIIGEVPEAFRHPQLGLTNVYVMYKKL